MSSGQYARRRIGLRGPLTGIVLLAIVGYGAYWGWQSAFGEDTGTDVSIGCPSASVTATRTTASTTGSSAAASTTAPLSAPPSTVQSTGPRALAPSDVTVNVFNATSRPGLAANTASALRARGFVVGDTMNDPLDHVIPGVGEIRAGTAEEPAVRLLIQHLPGATVVVDGRTDGTVDLVIGDTFVSLGDPATVTPVLLPSSTPC